MGLVVGNYMFSEVWVCMCVCVADVVIGAFLLFKQNQQLTTGALSLDLETLQNVKNHKVHLLF